MSAENLANKERMFEGAYYLYPKWLMRMTEIGHAEKAVLVFLIDRVRQKGGGRAFPAIPTVAVNTALSEKTVKRAIKRLGEMGFLSYGRRTFGGTNEYALERVPDWVLEKYGDEEKFRSGLHKGQNDPSDHKGQNDPSEGSKRPLIGVKMTPEEDNKKKPTEKKATSIASPSAPRTRAARGADAAAPEAGSGGEGVSRPKEQVGTTAHGMQSDTFTSESGGSGMLIPGQDDEKPTRRRKPSWKKGLHDFDPDKPPVDWSSKDALNYFRLRFQEAFPTDPAPAIQKKDMAVVRDRLEWLDESVGRATMKSVIDYIFSKWANGLRSRLRWTRTQPGFGLIESQRYLETLVDEAQHGTARRQTHDEHKPESMKGVEVDERGWPKQ